MPTLKDYMNLSRARNRLGKDICEKQDIIAKKAKEGRKMINMLKNKINIPINENEYNKNIMNLLHYTYYTRLIKELFLEWNNDEIIGSIGESSEQAYIEAGKMAKEWHDDWNEELVNITLNDLLFYKANGDENKMDKLYDIYHSLIGREWLDAKFLKSLKTKK